MGSGPERGLRFKLRENVQLSSARPSWGSFLRQKYMKHGLESWACASLCTCECVPVHKCSAHVTVYMHMYALVYL